MVFHLDASEVNILPSDHLSIHTPTRRGRRHTPTSLLPLLSRRNGHVDVRRNLLGCLETGTAVRVQVPPGTKEGSSRRRDCGHPGESTWHCNLKVGLTGVKFSREKVE